MKSKSKICSDKYNKVINVIATTDIHGDIIGYNYEKDKYNDYGGMAKISTYVEKIRKENPNTILLDNGDAVQGTILSDDVYREDWKGIHPVIESMNYMKYDAMTLGNHEFNMGLDVIERLKDEVEFPLLAANVIHRKSKADYTDKYTILQCSDVKIGVVGLTTPNIPLWLGEKVNNLEFKSLRETAKKCIEEIKDKVDIIVVMAHAPLQPECIKLSLEDGAASILKECPEVNILIVGHLHITVNEKIKNTLVGGATDGGREVVHFSLYLDENKHIVKSDTEIVSMKDYERNPKLLKIKNVWKAHENTVKFVTEEVLGIAKENFQPINEIPWITEGRLKDTPLIELINKVQLLSSGADVSGTSLIRESGDIKRGIINYGTIYDIYKFNTYLYVVKVTGKELREYMEWTASAYNTYKDGDLSISFSFNVPGYQQDMFSGINYKINICRQVGKRIEQVLLKGKPLLDNDVVKLAVSDYCYNSILVGRGFTKAEPIWKSQKLVKEMLVDYIKGEKNLYAEVDNNWEIIGTDFDLTYRKKAIELVKSGEIPIPYDESLNKYKLIEQGYFKSI